VSDGEAWEDASRNKCSHKMICGCSCSGTRLGTVVGQDPGGQRSGCC
jgi:hypothetical protein